jgi:hypothetical protein
MNTNTKAADLAGGATLNPQLSTGSTAAPGHSAPPAADAVDTDNPFPQAARETDRAFEAFRVYLQLGPRRRYLAVGRKVGAGLSTIKRWARDFDWRGRIKTYATRSAVRFVETEAAAQREELLDAAARAKSFRERQYALAEAILLAAERYLEHVDDDDLDQMNFADACKALEVGSRLGQQAAARETDDPAATRSLRDQLATLLDQAYNETPSPAGLTTPQPQTNAAPTGATQS